MITPRQLQRRLEATGASKARLCAVAGYPVATLDRILAGRKVAYMEMVMRDLAEALERVEREVTA